MESNRKVQQERSEEHSEVKLEDVDSFIEYMEGLLEELWGKINQLPEVDQNGHSDCHFAEELYAYKEEAAAIVAEESKKLQVYLELVKKEIDRCHHNIDQLRTDRSSLNFDEAKKRYDAAKKAEEKQLNKAILQKKKLIDLIKKAEELLSLAKEKNWPLGEPKRQDSFNPEAVLQGVLDGTLPGLGNRERVALPASRPAFHKEVNDLMSIAFTGKNS